VNGQVQDDLDRMEAGKRGDWDWNMWKLGGSKFAD
jgi:hypothetical protein